MHAHEIAQSLQAVGLTQKEAEVYLALLSLQSATAYRVAEKCEVKTPTVYLTLEDLRRKGLALKVPHAKKALYAAVDIEEYLRERRKHLDAVRAMAPYLHAMSGEKQPSVYFFTGVNGLKEALNYKIDTMRGKRFHSFYGNFAGSNEVVADFYHAWDKKAVAMDIAFDLLIFKNEKRSLYYENILQLAKQNPEQVRTKFLKEYPYPPTISVEIAESFVRIVNDKDLQATVIDDPNTASAFRTIFSLIWDKKDRG